jgi:hypothetical protein
MAPTSLQAALATTEAMLDCARGEQWEAVLALGPRHAEVIGRLRADAATLRDPESEPGLRRLEAMTRDLAGLVASHRDDLGGSLRQLHKGRRAARAYGQR